MLAYPVKANWLENYLFIVLALAIAAALIFVSCNGVWSWWLLPIWLLWLFAVVLGLRRQYCFRDFCLRQQHNSWWQQLADDAEPAVISDLTVLLDCQQIILVKALLLRQERVQPHWFWLQQRQAPQQWHLLRCALFRTSC